MDRVGVRELRQNLSVYLRRVRRGEALEVTERGEPVAILQPIVAPVGPSGIAFLGDAARFVSLGRTRIPEVSDDSVLRASVDLVGGDQELFEVRSQLWCN